MQFIDNNNLYSNPYSSSLDDSFTWAYDTACATTQKLTELGQKYLSPAFLYEKAVNATKAKVLPLSNPAGWDEKMQNARKTTARLNTLKQGVEAQIHIASLELNAVSLAEPNKSQKIKNAEEKLAMLNDRYQGIENSLRRNQELITFYEQQRTAQIGARFAGYVGMATNVVVPGAGLITSLAVTGATTLAQENLVNNISEDNPKLAHERKNVRIATMCTIACTIVCVAFSIWAMPIIKDAILTGANNTRHS